MDLLNKYIEELSQDTHLDEFNLKDAQLKLPGIKHKWVGRLIRSKIDFNNLKGTRYALINTLTDKLIDQSPVTVSRPTAQKKVLSHESVTQLDMKIQELDSVILFLEKIERVLNSMTFDIKNLTEIMKLEIQ
jgi:hypothetical protein